MRNLINSLLCPKFSATNLVPIHSMVQEMHVIVRFSITFAGNVQNMKPVQNCTDFIFSTFHALAYTPLK